MAAGIIASTVLVKQHDVVDLVAGAMVYAVAAVFLRRMVHRIPSVDRAGLRFDCQTCLSPKARA